MGIGKRKKTEVEKCPKCGGKPGFRWVGDWKTCVIMECNTCGYVAAEFPNASATLWGALRVWNKKARELKKKEGEEKQ